MKSDYAKREDERRFVVFDSARRIIGESVDRGEVEHLARLYAMDTGRNASVEVRTANQETLP